MENWRGYQDSILAEEQLLLTEAGIADILRTGFKKLMNSPKLFDELVAKAKKNFEKIFLSKLANIQEDDKMQLVAKEIAAKINQLPIQEVDQPAVSGQKDISLKQLKNMGIEESTLEFIATSLYGAQAESVLESCEEAIGKQVPPRVRDFLLRFLKKSAKMIMFGFIDNFIMIIAGDMIDAHIGTTLGISTMAAAGFGNLTSDVAGEEAGSAIEKAMEAMGLDAESVSDEQMEAAPAWMRFLDARAGSFGVAIGCILGMVPLLFMREDMDSTEQTFRRDTK
jgi:hypothetical protein